MGQIQVVAYESKLATKWRLHYYLQHYIVRWFVLNLTATNVPQSLSEEQRFLLQSRLLPERQRIELCLAHAQRLLEMDIRPEPC